MSIYSDKLAHVQVVINCRYSVAQLCTREDTLAHNLGTLYFDDVMSYNLLTTLYFIIVIRKNLLFFGIIRFSLKYFWTIYKVLCLLLVIHIQVLQNILNVACNNFDRPRMFIFKEKRRGSE